MIKNIISSKYISINQLFIYFQDLVVNNMTQIKSGSEEFNKERDTLNQLVMKYSGKTIKRFYGLDSSVYRGGTLPKKTKELLGLVASFVLRCDDCVKYHLGNCKDEGITDEELEEVLAIGLIIGGSITIPTLRRAYNYWDKLNSKL